jgi:hypothetical protein
MAIMLTYMMPPNPKYLATETQKIDIKLFGGH